VPHSATLYLSSHITICPSNTYQSTHSISYSVGITTNDHSQMRLSQELNDHAILKSVS